MRDLADSGRSPVLGRGTVAIVGAGSVGSSVAHACLARGSARSLALYDVDAAKVEAEVLDLAQGAGFARVDEVRGGTDPAVLEGADVVVVAAGARQQPGQLPLDLAVSNVRMLERLMPVLVRRAPDAVFVLATSPCDVLTVAAQGMGGLPAGRVLATGTLVDSRRLRFVLARRAGVDVGSVHAHLIGAHGESEFPQWSQARIGPVPVRDWRTPGESGFTEEELSAIAEEVRHAAYRVIERKGATNHALGLAGTRLVEAILGHEHLVAPVSSVHEAYRGDRPVAFSLPSVIGAGGVERVLDVRLDMWEEGQLDRSVESLLATLAKLGL